MTNKEKVKEIFRLTDEEVNKILKEICIGRFAMHTECEIEGSCKFCENMEFNGFDAESKARCVNEPYAIIFNSGYRAALNDLKVIQEHRRCLNDGILKRNPEELQKYAIQILVNKLI